ncbi:MAG: hypothetical protein HY874_10130 [Chloroflexi bacterium]|nr:hypothetical protein [Chloroflexota bacterium]
MIVLLLTSLALPPSPPASLAPNSAALVAQEPTLDAKIAAAGKDVAKLLELADACAKAGKEDDARKVFRKVLEADAKNETAHKGLRHQLYDGKWFESLTELAKYKREEAARMKVKGLARFGEQWVPEAELPFLQMGWAKDDKGAFVDPFEVAKAKQNAELEAAGSKYRADDDSWVAPADFDQWEKLLWKCGDEWVDMAKANEYHAKLEHTWDLASDHFVVSTTCDWDGGNLARWHAEKAYPELVRLFGTAPKGKLPFVVLNSLAQYNEVAGNTPLFPEADGFSSLHGAYFADLLFDNSTKPPRFLGCGVSYWDRKDAKVAAWGPFWARWAAAQSFVDAIDPSWSVIGERVAAATTGGAPAGAPDFAPGFWAEKKIPRWLRYGAAAYVECFMKNPEAPEGADPWTIRAGAFADVKKAGGLRKLDEVFAFKLELKDTPGSMRLYQEVGVIVSYLLDGAPSKDLAAKLEAFQAALKTGKKADVTKAADALEKALVKSDKDLRKFAGL